MRKSCRCRVHTCPLSLSLFMLALSTVRQRCDPLSGRLIGVIIHTHSRINLRGRKAYTADGALVVN